MTDEKKGEPEVESEVESQDIQEKYEELLEELELKEKELQEVKQALEKQEEETKEYISLSQRLQADFENFKKITDKRNKDLIKFANEDIIKDFLDCYEDFGRALEIENDDDLKEGVAFELSSIPVTVSTKERNVLVNFQELLICGISVEDEGYWIFNASSEWADKTTYLCEEDANGTWKYYLETIDECIGESKRLVMFEAQKGKSTGKPGNVNNGTHTSELSKILDDKTFENTFAGFIAQADKNAISGKGEGGQTPVGFSAKPSCDGADISTHYGQGGASKTPYLNWWVVSIYYTPDNGNIMMGIEETRYPHLKEMQIKPLRYAQIGNKKVDVAIFYSATKSSINYSELREGFMNVCEEVMRLGLK